MDDLFQLAQLALVVVFGVGLLVSRATLSFAVEATNQSLCLVLRAERADGPFLRGSRRCRLACSAG